LNPPPSIDSFEISSADPTNHLQSVTSTKYQAGVIDEHDDPQALGLAEPPKTENACLPSTNFDPRYRISRMLWIAYFTGNFLTFVKLSFFDGFRYTWWNWLIALPINEILAGMWPIYWIIIRPIFGR